MKRLSKMANSLRFRLFLALGLLVMVIIIMGVLNIEITTEWSIRAVQQDAAAQQGTNAYLLASLARRLSAAKDERSQQGIQILIEDAIHNFDEIHIALREGSETLDIQPIQ